ncbi:MAG: hypothetical protein OSA98_25885 [Rubripirellula sp.]|nr:hypothetical protein [Rubripirellula sp.]
MTDANSGSSLSRRHVLRRFFASGVLATVGCQNSGEDDDGLSVGTETSNPETGQARPAAPPAEFVTVFRIFKFEVQATAERTLSGEISKAGGIPNEVNYIGPNQDHVIFGWIDPKHVDRLTELPGVEKSEKVSADSIVEPAKRVGLLRNSAVNPPAAGQRVFYAVLGPNSWSIEKPVGSFESAKDIAQQFPAWSTKAGTVEVRGGRGKDRTVLHVIYDVSTRPCDLSIRAFLRSSRSPGAAV